MAFLTGLLSSFLSGMASKLLSILVGSGLLALLVWYIKKLVNTWLAQLSNEANEQRSQNDQNQADQENQQDSKDANDAENDVRNNFPDGGGSNGTKPSN